MKKLCPQEMRGDLDLVYLDYIGLKQVKEILCIIQISVNSKTLAFQMIHDTKKGVLLTKN